MIPMLEFALCILDETPVRGWRLVIVIDETTQPSERALAVAAFMKRDAALVLHEGRERKANRISRGFQKKRIGPHQVPLGGGRLAAAAQRARHNETIDRLARQRESAILAPRPHGLIAHRHECVGSSGDVSMIEPQSHVQPRYFCERCVRLAVVTSDAHLEVEPDRRVLELEGREGRTGRHFVMRSR